VQIQARLAGPRVALVSRSRPLLPPHATAATPLAPRLGALPWPHPGSVPSARPPCPAPHLCRTAPLFPLVRTWWADSSEEARSSFDCCRRHALSPWFRAWPGLPVTSAMVSSTRPIGSSTCLCCGGAGGSRHRCLRWLRLQGDEDGDPGPGREVAQADAGVAQQRAPRPHQPGHGPQVQGERDREVRARACSRVWRRCGCRRRRRGRPGRAAGASSRRAPPHALTPASRPARTTALCIGRVGHRPGHRGGCRSPWPHGLPLIRLLAAPRTPTWRLATTTGWAVTAMAPPRPPSPRRPLRGRRPPRPPRLTPLLEGAGAGAAQRWAEGAGAARLLLPST